MSNNAKPLTLDRAYELGYQRGLEDFDKFYREACDIASDAIGAICDDDDDHYYRYSDDLWMLNRQYERARNALTEHDNLDTSEGKTE
jgi:hypothetical protein